MKPHAEAVCVQLEPEYAVDASLSNTARFHGNTATNLVNLVPPTGSPLADWKCLFAKLPSLLCPIPLGQDGTVQINQLQMPLQVSLLRPCRC